MRVWEFATGTCVKELKGHTSHVPSVAWLPDSKTLVSGGVGQRMWGAQPVRVRCVCRWGGPVTLVVPNE